VRKILGIHDGHNGSAALVADGRLRFAIQEERLTGVKNQGGMPAESLRAIDEKFGLADVERVILAGERMNQRCWSRDAIVRDYRNSTSPVNLLKQTLKKSRLVRRALTRARRLGGMPRSVDRGRIACMDHHLSHAAAAYYGRGEYGRDVLVVTCDGSGDWRAGSVYRGRGGKLEPLISLEEGSSLGRVYSYFTYLYNMTPYEHEYKIMGLAPYCTDKERIASCKAQLERLFAWNKDGTMWRYSGRYPAIQAAGRELAGIFRRFRFDVAAAGLQQFTEETLVRWIGSLAKATGIGDVALSGGVFMNVKANKLIAECEGVRSCFVFPSCGDETNAIGAALAGWREATGENPEPLRDMYLGDEPIVGPDEITSLPGSVVRERPDDVEAAAARLLAQGQIVGRVKGPMEFGARALGDRSILANPSRPETVRTINEMIKGRDFWMPFAPTVLQEDFERYFRPCRSVVTYDYMTFAAESLPEKREYCRAALHPYDHTGRPQTISRRSNPDYWRLLAAYKELTGEGLILNTSYNLHGSPIVRTARQAIEVFLNSGLEHLALGEYLLHKKSDG